MRYVHFWQSLGISMLVAVGVVTIAPETARAQPGELDLVVNADPVPDFRQLVTEAETLLTQRISQAFADNLALTSLRIQILAERNGAIVPLMMTEVSRREWERDNRIANWTRYFDDAQVLLSYVTVAARSPEPESPEPDPANIQRLRQQGELQDTLD